MIVLNKLELEEIEYGDIWEEYTRYETDASEFRYQISEDEDFFLGNQLTDRQKEYLESVGQPPESNNKIRPAVEQVLSNIASSAPEWDVKAIGKTDNDMAVVFNTMLDKIWYDSGGNVEFRRICKDFIVKGLGYMFVYPNWTSDAGLGAVRVKRLPPESIFVDPNSTLPDFSDATSIIYSDLHTKENLKILFPQFSDLIEEAEEDFKKNEQSSGKYSRDQALTRADENEDDQSRVRKYVRWSKVQIPLALIIDTQTGATQKLNKDQYKEFVEDPKYKQLIDNGEIQEDIVYEQHVREICSFGDQIAYDEILPISEYPIIPACNEHTGTPFPVSDVRFAKSPQRMLNRTEALLISHTSATTNFKLVYEDGAIDPNEIDKWNIPNAIIRANPGALREGKIREFAPPAVSSQLFMEKQRYELDIEQVFGAYKYLQGMASEAPGTVGEAQIVGEAVARKQNWKILPIYDMLTKAANLAMQYIPFVYDQQRVIRCVMPMGDEVELTLNQPVIDDKTGAIMKMYNVKEAMMDVRAIIGSTRAKSPMAELQKDLNLLNVGIYDKTQVIMGLEGDIDKGSLIARMGEISQLQQQVQMLAEENDRLKGDLQTREREVFHSTMRAKVAEAGKPVTQAVSNLKANAKLEQARQQDKTRLAAEDLNRALNNTVNSQSGAEIAEG